MVVLRYSTCTTRDDVEGGGAVFEVDTPIMTYLMKAKHNVAREEWIKAIEKNRFVKKKKKRLAALSPRGNALPNFCLCSPLKFLPSFMCFYSPSATPL